MRVFVGDFFSVQVTEDSVYGTPIFTTVGGKSKCPGETGTSKRDSGVTMQIIPRCCRRNPADCNCNNLPTGAVANFGIVVENMSPTCTIYHQLLLCAVFTS